MSHSGNHSPSENQEWPDIVSGDTITYVRSIDVSCAESPYVLLNIHFTGPCDISCPECHSRALWCEEETDRVGLKDLMSTITNYHKAGIIEGICIMGTDGPSKKMLSPYLVRFARASGMKTVVFVGADIHIPMSHYGRPDYFVTGPYEGGEWHTHKKFYMKNSGEYIEISMQRYFTLQSEGVTHGDQIQL